ncbi:hypothetical protein [Legionella spiritensis]|uniref:Uncharacterized protein n=1 Tax=Legionella spiritensis TaxID=452 RepID=A0A0W0Z8F5_LEGSP|nr:hypothetical protein [Legionella spiritensis]KTD65263.1 hypothetical protein Lspi_0723 [Legionella spiritensis]SNV30223.1 Uncharacterised protein [Legionella spiritensis]
MATRLDENHPSLFSRSSLLHAGCGLDRNRRIEMRAHPVSGLQLLSGLSKVMAFVEERISENHQF